MGIERLIHICKWNGWDCCEKREFARPQIFNQLLLIIETTIYVLTCSADMKTIIYFGVK